jgi:hypothetical protein
MKKRAFFLFVLGTLQIAGNCTHTRWAQSLGFATAASPAPMVFCSLEDQESFANRYFLDWKDLKGEGHSIPIDHSVLARLKGPEARRSMYLLTLEGDSTGWPSLNQSIRRYAVCGPLLKEWGVDPSSLQWPVTLRVVPVAGSVTRSISYGDPCQ